MTDEGGSMKTTTERADGSESGERVQLAHGGGGAATKQLIEELILPRLANPLLDPLTDGALLEVVNSQGDRARPGELVDLTQLSQGERQRLIIRVLCGLVAEVPDEEAAAAATG